MLHLRSGLHRPFTMAADACLYFLNLHIAPARLCVLVMPETKSWLGTRCAMGLLNQLLFVAASSKSIPMAYALLSVERSTLVLEVMNR